jgi:predicted Zn-dependent protease
VGAVSPQKDAVVVLTLSEESSREAAAKAFFAQQGIERGSSWRAGFETFRTIDPTTGSRRSQGIVGFVDHGEHVYQLLGYSVADAWSGYQNEVQTSLSSFGPLHDRKYLDVEPKRIEVIEVASTMTLAQLAKRHPSSVDNATLALINGVAENATFETGTLVKLVVGGALPED